MNKNLNKMLKKSQVEENRFVREKIIEKCKIEIEEKMFDVKIFLGVFIVSIVILHVISCFIIEFEKFFGIVILCIFFILCFFTVAFDSIIRVCKLRCFLSKIKTQNIELLCYNSNSYELKKNRFYFSEGRRTGYKYRYILFLEDDIHIKLDDIDAKKINNTDKKLKIYFFKELLKMNKFEIRKWNQD